MERRITLQELVQKAGVAQDITRQPCLPAPTETAVLASEEDQLQARTILLDRRAKNPERKDVLKRIFSSSKDRKESQDVTQFSQEELDQALSAVLRGPTTNPGLTQAFINLGANVNFIETPEKKRRQSNQLNAGLRRRSTVLQQAATLRRPNCVSLLASAGADQTTLDEGLKAALAAKDQECVSELLRHGGDPNKFPNALANAVRTNDQNFVRTLLRAPKALQPKIVSSCLPAAVQQMSEPIVSLLIAYGADPNFDSSSALNMAIGQQNYRLTLALVAGPIALTQATLQRLLDTSMRLPTCEAQLQFLQILLCCGLDPDSIGLPDLLICRTRKNDTPGVLMMLSFGVSTATNEAECLRVAISNSNWRLADAILQTPISPQQASVALAAMPANAPQLDRLRIIQSLVHKGATGPALELWLTRSVEDGDISLMDLLISAGASVASSSNSPIFAAIQRKDMRSLQTLLNTHPSPEVLSRCFPLLRVGYTASERLTVSRMLLQHGARGPEVDKALVDSVADTSPTRDPALITELVRRGANVSYNEGKVLQLAASQVDLSLLRLLCNARPTPTAASAALALAFDSHGNRHARTAEIVNLLLAHGVDERPALQTLQIAIRGGPENLDIVKQLIATNIRLLSPAFEYTTAIEDPMRKTPILEVLLKMGVGQDALDKALAAETRHAVSNKDTTSTKMLMEKGASVSHNDGEALSVAVTSRDSSLTTILLSGKQQPSPANVKKAFIALFAPRSHSGPTFIDDDLYKVAQQLLACNVDPPAIDMALRVALSNPKSSHYEPLIDMLLQYNANVNTSDGVCFVFAAQKHHTVFEKLMLHGPLFSVIVPALISSKLPDELVVKSIKSCFAHGCSPDALGVSSSGRHNTPVLILAMREYPRCEALIATLLDHGLNPDVSVKDVIEPSVGEECVSPLLWALNQEQKRVSDSVITALLNADSSVNRTSSASAIAPIHLASQHRRGDLARLLLERGADASARDRSNRSALFYASSVSNISTVQVLAPYALKNDGSLHEAARYLQLDVATTLVHFGHQPNFPSRLHQGRHALSELCLNAHITAAGQRSAVRRLIDLFVKNGADAKLKARGEKSAVILALDNAYSALEIAEALLETELWEGLNDEKHMYRDQNGLWYSPLKYVELIPSPSRAAHKQDLIDLLRDKGCEPRFFSETAIQPPGAVGIPKSVARLVDRQKEHELALKHEQERHEHGRTLGETTHRDLLRRKKEKQDADLASAAQIAGHQAQLDQQTHESSIRRVRDAERMKRSEKIAWHNLIMEQENDASSRRQAMKDRESAAAAIAESRLIEQRKGELEHRATMERRMLKDKEDVYERNVKRQVEVLKRADESAMVHARAKQERPAIEGPQWGSVD
jgi:ankyrin repeat protein